MPSNPNQGITRRDLLKKGAALGGAVVWVTPIVQSVGMGRAFAQAPSPCDPGISYIAMNVTCFEGGVDVPYFIKWEATNGFTGEWEPDPGSVPECEGIFSPMGAKTDGGLPSPPGKGFVVKIDSSGFATVTPGPGCTVLEGVVKGGSLCSPILGTPTSLPFTVPCPTG